MPNEFKAPPMPNPKDVLPKTLDFTKPVQTKDGRAVVILSNAGPNNARPMVGYVVGEGGLRSWRTTGEYFQYGEQYNLVQAKTKKTVTIYRTRNKRLFAKVEGEEFPKLGRDAVKLHETTVEFEE